MQDELIQSLAARKGHFRFESGHHGDLWLDLELLCLRPDRIRMFAVELANRLSRYNIESVCGPLVEGAFVALMVAAQLEVEFSYSERFALPPSDALYAVQYRIPPTLRDKVRGKRVAIVNDVINAGSAVRGTCDDLQCCGASTVAIGALAILGTAASTFAADKGIPLESIAQLPNNLWTALDCPLCASGVPLEDAGAQVCRA